MNISQKQPIAKIGSKAPTKQTMVGLKTLTEKIPATPYTRKMVSPSGNVTRVVLATGRTIGGTVNNPYGNAKLEEKLNDGWLLYSECPVGTQVHIEGETRCKGIDPRRPGIFWQQHPGHRYAFIEEQCCGHIEQAIRERQADHAERTAEYAEQFQGSTDKLVARLEENARREAAMSMAEPGHGKGKRG